MLMLITQKLYSFMQDYIMIIAHTSHQEIISGKDTSFKYKKLCVIFTFRSP
jgi:hypothetical protein